MTAEIIPPSCPAHDSRPSSESRGLVRTPPGPRGLPLIGVAPWIACRPYEYFPTLIERYGDVVSIPVPGMRLVLLGHPRHVNHVFVKHMDRYTKGEIGMELIDGGEAPLVLREGADWKRVRRVLNPKFTEQALSGVSEPMFDEITTRVDGWSRFVDDGEVADLDYQFSLITIAALLRAMFERPSTDVDVVRLHETMNDYANAAAIRMFTHDVVPQWMPRPLARRGRLAHNWINDYIDRFIAERRGTPTDTPDLLNTLLDARFEDGKGFTDPELQSEIAQLLFAGADTTSTALAWTFAFLGANADALARAYAEVDALGGRPVSHADISGMTWLRACFDEAQRLQGAPFHARMALVDDEIDGFTIRKGTYVTTSMHILHRDPRWWREPERFDPDRFATDEINKNAFMPFSVGPRRCLGMRMAYIEAVAIIATILQRYEFDLEPDFTPRHHLRVSTAVKGGVPVRLRRR